ncbi:MAG TPA: PucR family transcriptional regulator [Marmoricola sp.]|nr:PucR family transcriptional regulator [Marmoricola sp.]
MPTVRELLDDGSLALRPVHLPDPAVEVRWVATSELTDPTPFLEGGELLLTTGLDTAGWGAEWDDYVARLSTAGVAAVGLGVGLTHPGSPSALVEACRRQRVNLLEVPRETTFVAVSRATARMLEEDERTVMQSTLAVQRQLTEAALRDDDVAVLSALAATGGATCLATGDGAVDAGPFGDRPDLLAGPVVAEQVARMRPRGLRAAASASTPGGTVLVHPLGLRGRPSAYLAAAFPGRPTALQRSSVATAVALLGMAAERRLAGLEADRRIRARALEVLVGDDEHTASVLLSARSGTSRTRVPERVVVVRAAGPREALEDALARVERDQPISGLVGDELVVVVPPRAVAGLASALVARGLRVGVGAPAGSAAPSHSHRTAAQALALATDASPSVSWESSVRHGVLSLVDGDRAAVFARSYLAPLLDRADLLETLASFLRHHGSQLQVSLDLGVHRNTVRHRVGLIEGALGDSLQDPRVRVNAWVALQALAGSGPA